jgi:hypothetical protein
MAALYRFYVECLGLCTAASPGEDLSLTVGAARLRFVSAAGTARPFYHLALLIPGNRYDAAHDWLVRCATLLSKPGERSTTFGFDSWDATACYFHDPAGNIVELIAHRGICEGRGAEPFDAGQIAGISEVGLVVADPPVAADALAHAGLHLWSGDVEGDDALGFVGRQAHTLILSAPARPWMPTLRPAECHPLTVTLRTGTANPTIVSVADGMLSID